MSNSANLSFKHLYNMREKSKESVAPTFTTPMQKNVPMYVGIKFECCIYAFCKIY